MDTHITASEKEKKYIEKYKYYKIYNMIEKKIKGVSKVFKIKDASSILLL